MATDAFTMNLCREEHSPSFDCQKCEAIRVVSAVRSNASKHVPLKFDESEPLHRGFMPLSFSWNSISPGVAHCIDVCPQRPCRPMFLALDWYASESGAPVGVSRPKGMLVSSFDVGQNRMAVGPVPTPFEHYSFANGDLVPIEAESLSVGNRVSLEVLNQTGFKVALRGTFWCIVAPLRGNLSDEVVSLRQKNHELIVKNNTLTAMRSPAGKNLFVERFQRRLVELGFGLHRCGVDGCFGPETERSAMAALDRVSSLNAPPTDAELAEMHAREVEAHARTQASLKQLERALRGESEPFEPGEAWECPSDES